MNWRIVFIGILFIILLLWADHELRIRRCVLRMHSLSRHIIMSQHPENRYRRVYPILFGLLILVFLLAHHHHPCDLLLMILLILIAIDLFRGYDLSRNLNQQLSSRRHNFIVGILFAILFIWLLIRMRIHVFFLLPVLILLLTLSYCSDYRPRPDSDDTTPPLVGLLELILLLYIFLLLVFKKEDECSNRDSRRAIA